MPAWDFKCANGHVFEEVWLPRDGMPPDEMDCVWCNAPAKRQLPLVADQKHCWGDSHTYYDNGLGCEIHSHQHRDQVCEEKGAIPLSDLPSGYIDTSLHQSWSQSKGGTP